MAFPNAIQHISELIVDLFRTALPPNRRWEISSVHAADITGYSGDPAEVSPMVIRNTAGTNVDWLEILGPLMSGLAQAGQATLRLYGFFNGLSEVLLQSGGLYNAFLSIDNDVPNSRAKVTLGGPAQSVNDVALVHGFRGGFIVGDTDDTPLQIGSGGTPIRALTFGVASVPVVAAVSGTAVINHGLGGAPVAIAAIVNGSSSYITFVTTLTATQFTLGVRQVDNVATTVTETVLWIAIR